MHYWSIDPESGILAYDHPLVGWVRARLVVQDFRSEQACFSASRVYARWLRTRANQVYPPGSHITDFITAQLLLRHFSPLHCSSFSLDNKAVVISAMSDVGKTYTVMSILKHEPSTRFLSEDIAVTDGVEVVSCPCTASIESYSQFTRSPIRLVATAISRSFPQVAPYFVTGNKTIHSFMPPERISAINRVGMISILERGPRKVTRLDPAEATRKLLLLNRYEFSFWRNPMLIVLSYVIPGFDLDFLAQCERAVMQKLTEENPCYLVTAEGHDGFWRQVLDLSERLA